MSKLKDIQNLAETLLKTTFTLTDIKGKVRKVNISAIGYKFKFDSAKKRFGCCNYSTKTISLSKFLCEANLSQIDGKITDTILHEIAHAICVNIYGIIDGRGHDIKWQQIAKQIGSNGKRCYSLSDFGGINPPKSKYTLSCPTCEKETSMHRKPKRSYACGSCCTNGYDEKHKLIVKQNY